MRTTPAPDIGDYLRRYRVQIVLGSLVVIGLLLPGLSSLLQKSGEGWEFHNLAVIFFLVVGWFLLTVVVVALGTPFRWAFIIGIAPAVSFNTSSLLGLASRYADAGQDFWFLVLTGDWQALQALLRVISSIFLVGIPSALIAYVIGRITRELLDEGPHESLSRVRALLLVALAVLSMHVGSVIRSSTSVSVLSP